MTPRFAPGEEVRIMARFPPGHVRTPVYVRGKVGLVERVLDEFQNPEREAYGVYLGYPARLYRVRIAMSALWDDYGGSPRDSLDIEVFEHWLERVTEEITP